MSRVHDALRKAAQENPQAERVNPPRSVRYPIGQTFDPNPDQPHPSADGARAAVAVAERPEIDANTEECIQNARRVEYHPLSDALLVNPSKPRQAPAEEFRTLRTRLNHLQTIQPLRTLVVTSASPAEGKSFTAANLALTQAQLADKRVLLADFDFRRPTVDKTFQIPSSPGITDYLQGKARIGDILRRIADTQLYLLTAGESVMNPLELLN